MIFERASDVVLDDVFLHLPEFVADARVFLKLEGLNPAGSVKLKTALGLIEAAEETGALRPGAPSSSRRRATSASPCPWWPPPRATR